MTFHAQDTPFASLTPWALLPQVTLAEGVELLASHESVHQQDAKAAVIHDM
jgi:hypothetical protein